MSSHADVAMDLYRNRGRDGFTDRIEEALAEAARPGQELRARIEALADELEKLHNAFATDSRVRNTNVALAYSHAADALRDALEDPR